MAKKNLAPYFLAAAMTTTAVPSAAFTAPLPIDLDRPNSAIDFADPYGMNKSTFAVTKTEQEHVGRVYRGGKPGDVGQKIIEYDLTDAKERKLFEDSIRNAQYEAQMARVTQPAQTANYQTSNTSAPVYAQPVATTTTAPLQPPQPLATPEPLTSTQQQQTKAVAPATAQPQYDVQIETANREKAKTMTADSGNFMSDAQQQPMTVLQRQQNPVAAAMQDLSVAGVTVTIPHGYQNPNGNFGSLTLRNVGDGQVAAYLGNGRTNGQEIGRYTDANTLQSELGIFMQNDANYNTQHSRQPANYSQQFNNSATYGGQYPQQTGGYGYQGGGYTQQQMEMRQQAQALAMQRIQTNGYYNDVNRSMGANQKIYDNGYRNVNRELNDIDRSTRQATQVFNRMSSGRGGIGDIIGLAGPVLRAGVTLPHVIGSVFNPNVSDPRPAATYPEPIPYPQYPQNGGFFPR